MRLSVSYFEEREKASRFYNLHCGRAPRLLIPAFAA